MKRMLVCLALLLALCSVPAFAGTVYVPLLSGNGVDDGEYLTRVWVTNESGGPQTIETVVIPMNADGTQGRDGGPGPDKTVVPAGKTSVIEISGKSGLLEITSEGAGDLAINAEVRHTGLNGSEVTHSITPVLTSRNMAAGGETLTLQGLRRSEEGVFTNLGLVNLGHSETQCTVKVFRAGGAQIAGTALLNLKPLTQVNFPDALDILGQSQAVDVNASISCDESFYAFLTVYERATGEAIFIRPSATDDSTLAPPGQDAPSVPGAVLFTQNGTFHTPTPGEPTKIYNIGVPGDRAYTNVVVDFDFFHAGWYGNDPAGNHSLVWLHRGACCWPNWKKNITVFANAFGPGKNQVKMISNMDLPGFEKSRGDVNFALQAGQTYHAHFEYDTRSGAAFMELSVGGKQVARWSMPTTVNRLVPDQDQAWMIYFGHENALTHGPERPTYGWKYQNLRVEFLP